MQMQCFITKLKGSADLSISESFPRYVIGPISTIDQALTIIIMINKQSVSFLSFRGA